MAFSSHEEYFEGAAADERPLLTAIQARVEQLFPEASRCSSYNISAFRSRRVFFYFAAFKKHIGIYPPVTKDAALIKELEPYRGEKGNLSFPLNQPLPIHLIGRVAVALNREYAKQMSRKHSRLGCFSEEIHKLRGLLDQEPLAG